MTRRSSRRCSRRSFVAAVSGAVVALAGCLTGGSGGDGDGSDGADDGAGDGGGAATETTAATVEPTTVEETDGGAGTDGTTTSSELDLREANVTGVELAAQGDGRFWFSVTLYHDDDGEDGYADWWVVETRDGEELGRRELLHAHGTREFTRSATVSVPIDVACVVVRGHDQTHGYGGQAALVSVDSGATRFVPQGSERSSLADADCP